MAPPDPAPASSAASATASVDLPTWQSLVLSDDAIIAECTVPAELRCLRGHFHGAPVVPGIALVGWVLDLLRRQQSGPEQPVRRLSRLRFRQPVLPGMPVTLTVRSNPAGPGAGRTWRFTLQREGTLCASGQIDL